jgi:hypothetical protein
MLQWESLPFTVAKANIDRVLRTAVPGGWLVFVYYSTVTNSFGYGGLTFYPDPDHEWDGGSV